MRPSLKGRNTRPVYAGRRRKRLIHGGVGALALTLPAAAVALTAGPLSSPRAAASAGPSNTRLVSAKTTVSAAKQRNCGQLFTVAMAERAANRFYAGNTAPSGHQLKVLGYIERCQRNPAAVSFVRGYDHRQAGNQRARVAAARAAAAARSANSGWAIPAYVVQCESGGQNLPPNYAGASGYYQIIPSTWLAYGGGQYAPAAYEATAQQQAAIASKIWDGGSGASQWVCAGR